MRIIVTGGGTGGHVFPAIEIAKEFVRQDPKIKVVYIGNKGGLEERKASEAGLEFYGLKTKKLVGQGLITKFFSLISLSLGIAQCLFIFMKKRPQAILGVGGYVSAPATIAGFCLGIPRFIAEQNVVPGFANQALGKISNRIFISFEESSRFFPSNRSILTGNPVRQEFFGRENVTSQGPLRILVTGGSAGAIFINEEVPKAISLAKELCPELKITHQTGKEKLSDVSERYQKYQIDAKVVPFIEDMAEAFKNHDLIISRAGATVIFEIMASGMAAILIPYRFANGHQKANAQALTKKGAALMFEEKEAFASSLSQAIKELYQNRDMLTLMGQKAKNLGRPQAASHMVSMVLKHGQGD